MPHRRTSSLFAAAASAATTAVTRLSATTAAAGRLSTTTAVSVVSVTAALALAAPVASAAPIPLRHHRSGNGITGAGHHALAGHPAIAGHSTLADPPAVVGHPALAGLGAPTAPHALTGTHPLTAAPALTGHGPGAGQGAPGRDHAAIDHLTVTVHDSGSAATDGTFELYCHPGRGNHPHVKRACKKLDGMTMWGRDPFAPVPLGTNCTMMYGGPATAHVTGTWAGRPVNADFRRTNGCEISRWGRFEPLLPPTSS
ncbi:SSI family serine proteinase inhibitor [Streptomyces sp. NRRL S-1813]|uniref:SSI family serine proteinase inhibitor n=1 Tax=Streptomyces sp. NRRL S-1813 TaxID=1463888 RepID=UPI0004CBF301|nr:SSI family serine proteinase inhibitor [Streptomyces sp. NRRL S-1813]